MKQWQWRKGLPPTGNGNVNVLNVQTQAAEERRCSSICLKTYDIFYLGRKWKFTNMCKIHLFSIQTWKLKQHAIETHQIGKDKMLRIPRASGAGRRGAGRGLVGQVGVGGHAWTPRWRRRADPGDPAVPFLRGPSSPRLLCLGTHSLQTRAEHLPPPTVRRSSQTTENLHQTK